LSPRRFGEKFDLRHYLVRKVNGFAGTIDVNLNGKTTVTNFSAESSISSVPEPSSVVLTGTAIALMGTLLWFRRSDNRAEILGQLFEPVTSLTQRRGVESFHRLIERSDLCRHRFVGRSQPARRSVRLQRLSLPSAYVGRAPPIKDPAFPVKLIGLTINAARQGVV
jgi:hypothetical protein